MGDICIYIIFQRAERQARVMDSAQYAEFSESRQLSFCKYCVKFLLSKEVFFKLVVVKKQVHLVPKQGEKMPFVPNLQ